MADESGQAQSTSKISGMISKVGPKETFYSGSCICCSLIDLIENICLYKIECAKSGHSNSLCSEVLHDKVSLILKLVT